MNTSHSVEQEALAGRLPVLAGNRVYKTYASFLWTCCAFSAATWAFLIGSYLPFVGDWRLGVMGYVVGLIIGLALVSLASGAPSYKYGTETIDNAKSSFGYRGIIVPLFGLLATLIGWSYVVEALTARGAANVAATLTGSQVTGDSHEHLVIGVGLAALFLVWFITCKGPKFFERLNGIIGPLHMLITLVMFGILIHKFGLENLWHNQVPPEQMLSHDPVQGLALAVEFGMSNAMTWWPVMGGLTRLVKHKNHVMGPSIIGAGILGAAVVSTVAALAAISAGTYDPTIWMIAVGGPAFGSIVMTVVLTANISTMVVMMYLAGVSIQQVKFFARLKWEILLALLLLPGVYFAFETEWLLSKVMSWLSYNGVMFVGITGITLVDYLILRREQLDAPSLFATRNSHYAYWGGVNWVAVVICILAVMGYLALYDPVTSAMSPWFRYMGASIPVIAISGVAYYFAVRLIVAPMGKGNYTKGLALASRPTLDSKPAPGAMRVSL
ncbi:cytosine permease [Pseudomonas sp. AMR01]|uniref:cytosine permease n=1 Tax=Pseudomonas sp. AMR01 TaxID=3064904 RepID=UPI0035C1EBFD